MKSKKLQKAAIAILASSMLIPSAVSAKEFKDVTRTNNFSWAYNDIDVLSDRGIINGYPDGTFKPQDSVSFEEVMQLISQVINPSETEIKEARKKYDKVLEENGVNDWAKNSIAIGLARGYVTEPALRSAASQGFFKLSGKSYPIRSDIAIFYAKALNLSPNGDTSLLKHKDIDKISSNAKGYLASLVKEDIFTATGSDGEFQGDRPIRRAEMAIITRASFNYVSKNPVETKKLKGKVLLASKLNNINLILIENNSKKYTFDINDQTKFKLKGKDAKFEDLKPNQEVEIEYTKSNELEKEGIAKEVNITNSMEELIGYVNSKDSNKLTIRYRQNSDSINLRTINKISTSDTKAFDLANDVKIKAYGKDLKLSDINVDDLVEFKVNNDNKITEIKVFPKEANVKGKVVYLDNLNKDKASIKLRLSDKNNYEFYITNDTKNIDDISLNDEVIIRVNYKVVVGKGTDNNEKEAIGVVNDIDLTGSSFDSYHGRRPYIEIRNSDGTLKNYFISDNVEIEENGRLRRIQGTENRLKGENVILRLDNRGYVSTIYLVEKGSQFTGMFQVIDANDRGGFNHSYYRNRLRVIQSNNSSLKPGSTIYFDTENYLSKYTVITFDGYLNKNTELQYVTNVVNKGNPGRELSHDYDVRRASDFRDYDYFDRGSNNRSDNRNLNFYY